MAGNLGAAAHIIRRTSRATTEAQMAQERSNDAPQEVDPYPQRRGWRRREVLGALAGMSAGALLPGCASAPPPPPMPVIAARAPKVGDTWTYHYTGGWANVQPQDLSVRVEEVGPMSIRDRMTVATSSVASIMDFTSDWSVLYRLVGNFNAIEFSPYLLAFDALEPGIAYSGIGMPPMNWATQWHGTARVVGREAVTVPAGTFETVRVEVIGNRFFIAAMMDRRVDPVYMRLVAWFSPGARRIVRLTHVTRTQLNDPLDRDDFQLTSLSLK
jgi:hypothetical protein